MFMTKNFDKFYYLYKTSLEVKVAKTPLIISKVNSKKSEIHFDDLSRLSNRYCLTKNFNENFLPLAISDQSILICNEKTKYLHIFDLNGNEKSRINIQQCSIYDSTWSELLNSFIISTNYDLQIYNIKQNQLKSIELSKPNDQFCISLTCHKYDLFVVLSDNVCRFSLPNFQHRQTIVAKFKSDDRISCIRTNGTLIAMTIRQHYTNQWRVDLFNYHTMIRTHRGLTIGSDLGEINYQQRCMLAPLNDHHWLIIGGYGIQPNTLTLMNDLTGDIKQIENSNESILNICVNQNIHKQILCMISQNQRTYLNIIEQ